MVIGPLLHHPRSAPSLVLLSVNTMDVFLSREARKGRHSLAHRRKKL